MQLESTGIAEPGLVGFLKGWGSLIIATIALVQPWAFAVWKKFFRPASIDVYETGLLELTYGNWGPAVGLRGTLRALHREQFIRKIELTVVKEKDGSKHVFDWLFFRAEKITGMGTEDTSAEIATGFMLLPAQPHRYSIMFSDVNTYEEVKAHIEWLVDAWIEYRSAPAAVAALAAGKDIFTQFSHSSIFNETFTAIDRIMYWEPGHYSLQARVSTTRPERTFTNDWSFEITKAESDRLRLNTVVLCKLACDQEAKTIFVTPKYWRNELPQLLLGQG